MKKLTYLLLIGLLGMATACASLTEAGNKVKYVTKTEAPAECKEIGEVTDGMMGSSSISQVKIKLRNETGEKGGNFLVIETIEKSYNDQGGVYYRGTGRAYSCP